MWEVGKIEVFYIRGMAYPEGKDGNNEMVFRLQ